MTDFLYLVPLALMLGLIGLVAFMWSLRNGQYEDLDGAAERILFQNNDDLIEPLPIDTRDIRDQKPKIAGADAARQSTFVGASKEWKMVAPDGLEPPTNGL